MNLEGVSPRVGHAYAVHADYAHKRNMRMRMKMSSTLATSIDSHSRHHKTAWVPLQVWAELAARDHLLPGDRRRSRSSPIQLAERGQCHWAPPSPSQQWSLITLCLSEDGAGEGWWRRTVRAFPGDFVSSSETSWRDFSTVGAIFFFKNSSLFLAFCLSVEGVGFFFFFGEDKAPFPLVSKEKEKDKDLPASVC